MKREPLERELKLKEIIASTTTTVLALYIVVFTFLGKSLFVLTSLGFYVVFLPVWFLAASAILAVSSLIHHKKLPTKYLLIPYTIGIAAIPVAMSLIYACPSLFWAD